MLAFVLGRKPVVREFEGHDLAIFGHPDSIHQTKLGGIIGALHRNPNHLVAERQQDALQFPAAFVFDEYHLHPVCIMRSPSASSKRTSSVLSSFARVVLGPMATITRQIGRFRRTIVESVQKTPSP